MSWKVELVHGPRYKGEAEVHDFEAAVQWVDDKDFEHHPKASRTYSCVEDMKQRFVTGSVEKGWVQYGTDYHYAVFTEVKEKDEDA